MPSVRWTYWKACRSFQLLRRAFFPLRRVIDDIYTSRGLKITLYTHLLLWEVNGEKMNEQSNSRNRYYSRARGPLNIEITAKIRYQRERAAHWKSNFDNFIVRLTNVIPRTLKRFFQVTHRTNLRAKIFSEKGRSLPITYTTLLPRKRPKQKKYIHQPSPSHLCNRRPLSPPRIEQTSAAESSTSPSEKARHTREKKGRARINERAPREILAVHTQTHTYL